MIILHINVHEHRQMIYTEITEDGTELYFYKTRYNRLCVSDTKLHNKNLKEITDENDPAFYHKKPEWHYHDGEKQVQQDDYQRHIIIVDVKRMEFFKGIVSSKYYNTKNWKFIRVNKDFFETLNLNWGDDCSIFAQ